MKLSLPIGNSKRSCRYVTCLNEAQVIQIGNGVIVFVYLYWYGLVRGLFGFLVNERCLADANFNFRRIHWLTVGKKCIMQPINLIIICNYRTLPINQEARGGRYDPFAVVDEAGTDEVLSQWDRHDVREIAFICRSPAHYPSIARSQVSTCRWRPSGSSISDDRDDAYQ